MKASIVTASALLIAGLAAAQSTSVERSPAGASAAVATAVVAPDCRAAAWPYVSAECGAQSLSRPVRVLRVEAER